MSDRPPKHYRDASNNKYFTYDRRNDRFVYDDGTSRPRPASIPASTFDPTTVPRSSTSQPVPLANPYGVTQQSPYQNQDGSYTYGQGSTLPLSTPAQPARAQDAASLLATLSINPQRPAQPSGAYPTSSSQARAQDEARRQVFRPRTYERNGLRVLETYNPEIDARTTIATDELNSSSQITDPGLLLHGVQAQRMLVGNGQEGERERLYSEFRVRAHSFFCVGRVFLVLWVEPAGTTVVTSLERNDAFLPGRYQGEFIYSKVRRFVVVRVADDYCSALPIASYGHQGVGKRGVNKAEHAIIYTGTEPAPLPAETPRRGEAGMRHTSIRVVPDNPTDRLDPLSRIDFGKVSTVQHNIKVKPFGMVHQSSVNALLTQFRNAWYGEAVAAALVNRPAVQGGPGGTINASEIPPPLNTPIRPVGRPGVPSNVPDSGREGSRSTTVSYSMDARAPAGIGSGPRGSRQTLGRGAASAGSAASQRAASASAQRSAGSAADESNSEDSEEDSSDDSDPSTGDAPHPRSGLRPSAGSSVRQPQLQTAGSYPASVSGASQGSAASSEAARSAQSAMHALLNQGRSSEQALEMLVQRQMANNPGMSREQAMVVIRSLLSYRG